jgi:aminoglycoside 6'-N-acetyltransferase
MAAGAVRVTVTHGERTLAGSVQPDESWAAAAARISATVPGDPMAVDLSGETKQFEITSDLRVALRAMTRGDLPDVARWRAEAHVLAWFAEDGPPDLQSVTEKYAARIDGASPIRMWVAEVNGRSVGFVQDYRIRDVPGFPLLVPDPDTIGVDYAIGEPEWVGRGLGARVLWAWMLRAHHRFPESRTYFAAPDHRNRSSLRMLDKAGFQRGTWFDEPKGDGTTATVVGCTLDVRRILG